jgi:hypothetical protein
MRASRNLDALLSADSRALADAVCRADRTRTGTSEAQVKSFVEKILLPSLGEYQVIGKRNTMQDPKGLWGVSSYQAKAGNKNFVLVSAVVYSDEGPCSPLYGYLKLAVEARQGTPLAGPEFAAGLRRIEPEIRATGVQNFICSDGQVRTLEAIMKRFE